MSQFFSVALSRARLTVSALAVIGTISAATTGAAAPQQVAELVLHGVPSHPKWIPEEEPLFGSYLASGDGEVSGAVVGHVVWDLYEDQSRGGRHPTFFRGLLERDGRRYPFEIIGVYAPESPDKRRWRISGAISFTDKAVLGTEHRPIIGTWEVSTRTSHFAIWADHGSR